MSFNLYDKNNSTQYSNNTKQNNNCAKFTNNTYLSELYPRKIYCVSPQKQDDPPHRIKSEDESR